jgi:hypothetical protein
MTPDPIAEAKDREQRERLPFIAVTEFNTKYEPQPDGSQKPVDWVSWVKKGTQNPAVMEEKVSRLLKFPQNPLTIVIGPIYERWKKNQSAPVDGTPLAAWPGATPSLVKALEPLNIRSVEDLALMEDSAIMKVSIPGLREKQKQARSYLEAQKSTAGVAAENLKLKEQLEAQASEIAELRAAVEALAEKDVAPIKRGPGRPPKQQAA